MEAPNTIRYDMWSRRFSANLAPSRAVNGSTTKFNAFSCDRPWQVVVVDTSWLAIRYDTIRRCLFLTRDDYELFMTRSQSRYAEDNRAAAVNQ